MFKKGDIVKYERGDEVWLGIVHAPTNEYLENEISDEHRKNLCAAVGDSYWDNRWVIVRPGNPLIDTDAVSGEFLSKVPIIKKCEFYAEYPEYDDYRPKITLNLF